MAQTPPKGDTDELKILDIIDNWYHEHTRVHLVDVDPDVMKNLIGPVQAFASQREIKILKEVWNRTQPSIVPVGTEPDELGKWLLSELKKRKEEV